MTQLLAHLAGDFLLQSDWMARNKTHSTFAAAVHAVAYGVPFLLLQPSLAALAIIVITHFFIDRFRLARFVIFSRNFLAPAADRASWRSCCRQTGCPTTMDSSLAFLLLGVTDATMHLSINYAALRWL